MEFLKREVIVVLGAAVRADGEPSQALRRRVQHALELARERPETVLVFTGGLGIYAPPEAEVMARLARAAGIGAERTHLEDRATNTGESARLTARLLRELARDAGAEFDTVTLVTDAYHQRRSRFAFRRMGVRAGSSSPHGSKRPTSGRWLREWLGLAWYVLTLR